MRRVGLWKPAQHPAAPPRPREVAGQGGDLHEHRTGDGDQDEEQDEDEQVAERLGGRDHERPRVESSKPRAVFNKKHAWTLN